MGEGVGGGGEHDDLAHLGGDRAVEPALVGDQDQIPHAVALADRGEHLVGVGELRDGLRAHERGRLEDAHPGIDQQLDVAHFVGRAHRDGLVLETVARTDLAQRDVLGQRVEGAIHARGSPRR